VTYHISVNSYYPGEFTLTLGSANPPLNDDYANALPITGTDFTLEATNIDATRENGLPIDNGTAAASVWWRWAAPHSGTFLISLTSTQSWFFPVIDMYSVTNPGIPYPDSYQQRLVVSATAGQQFDLRVAGSGGGMGVFSLSISNLLAPANDNFAAAAFINGFPASVSGSPLGATTEPLEPEHVFGGPVASVWYRWIAPSNTIVTLEINPRYSSVVAAYQQRKHPDNCSLYR